MWLIRHNNLLRRDVAHHLLSFHQHMRQQAKNETACNANPVWDKGTAKRMETKGEGGKAKSGRRESSPVWQAKSTSFSKSVWRRRRGRRRGREEAQLICAFVQQEAHVSERATGSQMDMMYPMTLMLWFNSIEKDLIPICHFIWVN